MAEVLRPVDKSDGLAEQSACRAFVAPMTARPAFKEADDGRMVHFAAPGAA